MKSKKNKSYKKAYQKLEKEWEKEGNSQRHKTSIKRINKKRQEMPVCSKHNVLVAGIGHYGGVTLYHLRKLEFKGTTAYFENHSLSAPKLFDNNLLLLFADPVENNFLITKKLCLEAKKKALVCLFCPLSPELSESDLKKLEPYVNTFVLLEKNQGPEFIDAFVEIIERSMLVGITPEDLNNLINSGKFAQIMTVTAEGKNKARIAAKKLATKMGKNANVNLLVIIHGDQQLSLNEIKEVCKTIEKGISKESNVFWNAKICENKKNKLRLHGITFYDTEGFKKLRLFEKINKAANHKMPECQTCEKKIKQRNIRSGHIYFCGKKCKKEFQNLVIRLKRGEHRGKNIPFDEVKRMCEER